MRLLAKRNVNPSEGIKPSESPNVGQYGWTSFEAHQYNQLIEYVNLAKESVDTCIKAATYVTKVMEEDVNPSFEKMGHLARNMEAMYIEFGKDYVVFGNNYEDFTVKYDNFVNLISDFDTDYSDFSSKYPDFVTKYNDVVIKHGEVAANTKRVEDLYNELKDGQVYRGVWNPSSGAYPNPEGTNSSWDVVLDEGKVTDTFDGKTWQNGHKLVWVVTDNAFTQIATAAGVVSINGKVGAVTLTAQDVNALPLTGGTLTGDLSVNTKIVAKNVGNPSEELILNAKDGVVKVGTNFVYHEGYKPTTAQLDAVPNTRLINNKQLNADITLTSADVKARPETWTPTAAEVRALPDSGNVTLNGEFTVSSAGEGGQLNLVHSSDVSKKVFFDMLADSKMGRIVNGLGDNAAVFEFQSGGSFRSHGDIKAEGDIYTRRLFAAGDVSGGGNVYTKTLGNWIGCFPDNGARGSVLLHQPDQVPGWHSRLDFNHRQGQSILGSEQDSSGVFTKARIVTNHPSLGAKGWDFNANGSTSFPGQITSGNITIGTDDSEGGQLDLKHNPTGKTAALDIVQASNTFRIINGMAGPTYVWQFDGDGVFTSPGTIKSYYGGNAVELKTAPHYTADVAQIFHNGTGSTSVPINIRSMRESQGATWLWEKVVSGTLQYSTGVNGGGANTITLNVAGGIVSARQFTQLTSEGKEAKVYSEINPPSAEDIFVASTSTKNKESLLDIINQMREEINELKNQLNLIKE